MRKVLVTATKYSEYCREGKKILLEYGCQIIENPHDRPYTQEELKAIVRDIDGVVVGVDTWNEEIFKKSPKLKIMARFGVGVDNIDLDAAKKHGIKVCNCPGVNTSAVAEQTVGLLLSLTRQIPFLNQAVRKGEWVRPMMYELKSRTVGFLGFGAIARDVAQKLQAFHPVMLAYDKFPNQEIADRLGVRICDLEELLASCHILCIHLPVTPQTTGLINSETISRMKDGVYLINTARGAIVDEKAVCEGLKTGKIAGMGTDVFASEPVLPNHPLFAFDHFVATPHTAAETFENCSISSLITAQAIIDVFEGREPVNRLV